MIFITVLEVSGNFIPHEYQEVTKRINDALR